MSDTPEYATEAERMAWLRARRDREVILPTGPLTAEQWRRAILSQMRADPASTSTIPDVAVWALVTAVDVDAIEEIIRRIGVYGVLDEPDEGGSGPNESAENESAPSAYSTGGGSS